MAKENPYGDVDEKIRQAREELGKGLPSSQIDNGLGNLLKDLREDPYTKPHITRHEELTQVSFSIPEESDN